MMILVARGFQSYGTKGFSLDRPLFQRFAALTFLCLGTFCALAFSQPDPQKILETWIEGLGDPDFENRENASKKLTEAGEKAIPLLEKAKKHPDPEIRHRASEILESFRFGILPNTPPQLRNIMIELKRQPSEEGKRREIRKLIAAGDIGIQSLERLVRLSGTDDESKNLLAAVIKEFPLLSGTFLKSGKGPLIRDFLEAFASREDGVLPDDYFRFAAGWDWILAEPLLGTNALGLGQDSKPLLANSIKPLSKAFSLRTAKKYQEAGQAVLSLKGQDTLRKGFLIESGMWKEAIASLGDGQLDDDEPEYFALMCTYQHMLGNEKAFDEWYAKYAKHREAGVTHGPEKIPGNLKILFLNDRPNEAMKKLKEGSPTSSLFQLYVARLELDEALALGGPANADQAKDLPIEMAIQRAKVLGILGKKKESRDLLVALKPRINPRSDNPESITLAENYLEACGNDTDWLQQTVIAWMETDISQGFRAKVFLKATGNDEDKGLGIGLIVASILSAKETTKEEKIALLDLFGGKTKADQAGPKIESLLKALANSDDKKVPPTKRPSAYIQLAKLAHFYKLPRLKEEILSGNTDPETRLELANHFIDQNQGSKAAEIINNLIESNPGSSKNWFARAKLLFKEKSPDFAKTMATAMLVGATDINSLTEQVGDILDWDEKRFGYLMPQYAIATSIPGTYENGKAYRLASKVFTQRKQFDAAGHALLQSQLRATHPDIYFVTVTAYLGAPVNTHRQMLLAALKKGDDAEIKKRTELIIQYLPYDVDLPIALFEQGKTPLAKELFEKYYIKSRDYHRAQLKNYPDSGWILNSTAWMMACCERDLPEAVEHARRATTVEPTRAGYWDTLAETLFQNGQKEEAIVAITKAIELNAQKTYYQRQKKRFEKGNPKTPRPDEDEGD